MPLCYSVVCAWLVWSLLGPMMMGAAINRWGDKFLFIDFSPNQNPSVLERRIAKAGIFMPLLVGLAFLIASLIHVRSWSDLASAFGVDLIVMIVLGIPGMIFVPFLIIVFTGFKVRPVID